VTDDDNGEHICPAVVRFAKLYFTTMEGDDQELAALVLGDPIYLRMVRRMVEITRDGMPSPRPVIKVQGEGLTPKGTSANTVPQ
jgi:hypothetical protein